MPPRLPAIAMAFVHPAIITASRSSAFLGRCCTHPTVYRSLVAMAATPQAPSTSSSSSTISTTLSTPVFKLPDSLPVPPRLSTLGHQMPYSPKSFARKLATSFRLAFRLRGRFPKNSILTARISGTLPDRNPSSRLFSTPELTLPALTNAIRLAAYDPRISHLHLRIDPLACGWAKVFELRRHLDFFAASGKTITAYMEAGGPKEFFLSMGYALYVPPDAALSLRGFTASGAFVRGVLDKIGISPQVERIGKYKSAGDQLARQDMSDAQREVLQAILSDVDSVWTASVVEATGISETDLRAFINRSPWNMEEYLEAGLIAGVCYESELQDALKLRFAPRSSALGISIPGRSDDDILKEDLPDVDVLRYVRRTSDRLLGISGRKQIAVIRAVGAITPGKSGSSPVFGSTVGSDTLVDLIRTVRNNKKFVGCILRCDSPGGVALASDIVWHELRKMRAVMPVVASQVDVAASGGYYLSMAGEIVSEPLTVTGSIGVVTAKPSLEELYKKLGYRKENISVGGKYAELLVDDRPFTEEELTYFRQGSQLAYNSFVKKAAMSRDKTMEEMEAVAQGRVWTGLQAKDNGLVDHIGGLWRAVEVLKDRADIANEEFVNLVEIRAPMSLSERFGLGVGAFATSCPVDRPLALAEVDGGLTGVSPLTQYVMDGALAPVVTAIPALRRWPQAIASFLDAIRV